MFSFEHVLVHLMERKTETHLFASFEYQPAGKEVDMTLPLNDDDTCRVRQGHAPV